MMFNPKIEIKMNGTEYLKYKILRNIVKVFEMKPLTIGEHYSHMDISSERCI